MVQNLKWATAHMSRRLGAGALGRAGVGVGALGWARGRVAGAGRAWARGLALQAAGRMGAAGVRSWRAHGRLGERQQARGAAQQVRGALQQARGGARQAQAGARGGQLGGQCAPGCAQLGQVGVLCTLTQFLARFDSVLFLSH